MCLVCSNHSTKGKEQIAQLFSLKEEMANLLETTIEKVVKISSVTGNYLRTYDNQVIELTTTQELEIIQNALAIVATGVDTRVDIWAIQWKNDYKPKNF